MQVSTSTNETGTDACETSTSKPEQALVNAQLESGIRQETLRATRFMDVVADRGYLIKPRARAGFEPAPGISAFRQDLTRDDSTSRATIS